MTEGNSQQVWEVARSGQADEAQVYDVGVVCVGAVFQA